MNTVPDPSDNCGFTENDCAVARDHREKPRHRVRFSQHKCESFSPDEMNLEVGKIEYNRPLVENNQFTNWRFTCFPSSFPVEFVNALFG